MCTLVWRSRDTWLEAGVNYFSMYLSHKHLIINLPCPAGTRIWWRNRTPFFSHIALLHAQLSELPVSSVSFVIPSPYMTCMRIKCYLVVCLYNDKQHSYLCQHFHIKLQQSLSMHPSIFSTQKHGGKFGFFGVFFFFFYTNVWKVDVFFFNVVFHTETCEKFMCLWCIPNRNMCEKLILMFSIQNRQANCISCVYVCLCVI